MTFRKLALAVAAGGCLSAGSTFAATDNVPEGMAKKAVRGAVDMVTGIVEVPMQTYKGYQKGFGMIKNKPGSKAVGTVLGLFRGFGHAAARTVGGGMELFGFWTVNHEDNKGVGVPYDAQYAWEMGEQYSMFKPSFSEGVKPVGRKLVRGLSDGFLGIAELPGQTMKGMSEGNVVKGLGKGVWFWLSREMYGFGNILLCLVPNHEDNPGVPFTGEYPWSDLSQEAK